MDTFANNNFVPGKVRILTFRVWGGRDNLHYRNLNYGGILILSKWNK